MQSPEVPPAALKEAPVVSSQAKRKRRGLIFIGLALGMLGFAFLNVPLFRLFCGQLGLYQANDPKLAAVNAAGAHMDPSRNIDIMFSGASDNGLRVTLTPENGLETVHPGQRMENKFIFNNPTDQTIRFQAIHNVYPDDAAANLRLIQCFCFSDQTLGPHQTKTLPVIYQLNPALSRDVQRVSLLYTLLPLAPAAGGQ